MSLKGRGDLLLHAFVGVEVCIVAGGSYKDDTRYLEIRLCYTGTARY